MHPRRFAALVAPPLLLAGGFLATAAPAAHAEVGVTDVASYDSAGNLNGDEVIVDPVLGGQVAYTFPSGTATESFTNEGPIPFNVDFFSLGNGRHICGGSLIAPAFATLTTHCTSSAGVRTVITYS